MPHAHGLGVVQRDENIVILQEACITEWIWKVVVWPCLIINLYDFGSLLDAFGNCVNVQVFYHFHLVEDQQVKDTIVHVRTQECIALFVLDYLFCFDVLSLQLMCKGRYISVRVILLDVVELITFLQNEENPCTILTNLTVNDILIGWNCLALGQAVNNLSVWSVFLSESLLEAFNIFQFNGVVPFILSCHLNLFMTYLIIIFFLGLLNRTFGIKTTIPVLIFKRCIGSCCIGHLLFLKCFDNEFIFVNKSKTIQIIVFKTFNYI